MQVLIDSMHDMYVHAGGPTFLDMLLLNALIGAREEEKTPGNYTVLSRDPKEWQQIRDDCKKKNQVICIEFLDEDMSRHHTKTEDLAREFEIPFLRVVIDCFGTFDEVHACEQTMHLPCMYAV